MKVSVGLGESGLVNLHVFLCIHVCEYFYVYTCYSDGPLHLMNTCQQILTVCLDDFFYVFVKSCNAFVYVFVIVCVDKRYVCVLTRTCLLLLKCVCLCIFYRHGHIILPPTPSLLS